MVVELAVVEDRLVVEDEVVDDEFVLALMLDSVVADGQAVVMET